MIFDVEITTNVNGKKAKFYQKMEAESTQELASKYQALEQLNNALSHNDFMEAKQMIIDKPQLVPEIKKIVEETETMSEAKILFNAPNYIRRFLKIFKN